MKKIQYQVINLKKPSKNIIPKLNIINSISKSNVSTSNFSSINPDKNIYTIESYEDIKNLINNDIKIKPFEYNNSSNPLFKSNDNIFSNKNNKKKTFVYIKKNHLYKNKDKKNKDEEIYNKKVLLNDYRKMIMKQFLNYFRPFCLFYLRKYFYCFIRNISYLIIQKELFYKTNTVRRIKKNKNSRNIEKSNDLYKNKSCDNFNKNKNMRNNNYIESKNLEKNKKENLRYKYAEDSENRNNIKYDSKKIINTPNKIYGFNNIIISFNKKNKKNNYTFFIKRIKNIITKDKKIYITINYIFGYPKKNNIISSDISKINSKLKLTQIYSLQYLSNRVKLPSIEEEEKENYQLINLIGCIHKFFIFKNEKEFIYKLKVINLIKTILKKMKLIVIKKLKLLNKHKEKNSNNDIFLLDEKMVIDIDNIRNMN